MQSRMKVPGDTGTMAAGWPQGADEDGEVQAHDAAEASWEDAADEGDGVETVGEAAQGRILDSMPAAVTRPLALVGGHAYLTTDVAVEDAYGVRTERVTLRDDGTLFAEGVVPDAQPLEAMELRVDMPFTPDSAATMSGRGMMAYRAGENPPPEEVFSAVSGAVDHFVDFAGAFGSQADMADLIACAIMASYAQDACGVAGYVMAHGAKGCGKTRLLTVMCALGQLGEVLTIGSTTASLRNLSAMGAMVGIDDCEKVERMGVSQDKRSLFLAGNRRGARMSLTVNEGGRRVSRSIDLQSPRVFTATSAPDPIMASRMIIVPFVRTLDRSKAARDPGVADDWPVDLPETRDALWAFGLENLAELRETAREVPSRISLYGRDLEPWRGLLGVALLLDERCGVAGLFERMCALAMAYHDERVEDDDNVDERILVEGLRMLFPAGAKAVDIAPARLADAMNRIANHEEIAFDGDSYTNCWKVGRQLDSLRVGRKKRTAAGKLRQVTRAEVDLLARRYGIAPKPEACVRRAVCAVSRSARRASGAPGAPDATGGSPAGVVGFGRRRKAAKAVGDPAPDAA